MLEVLDASSAHRLLFFTRLPFLCFPLLIVWLVWHWGRQIFTESTALALAGFAALEPTIMGHGPLIKSDVPAAFACLLFAYCAWRYWKEPRPGRLAGLLGSLLLAVLSKFSLLALIPVALVVIVWRGPRVAGTLLLLAAVYLGIAAAYQFRFAPVPLLDFEKHPPAGREAAVMEKLLEAVPWPSQFARGVRFIGWHDAVGGFGGYMLGRRLDGPAPWYFPLAWAVKFPISLQLTTLAGLVICLRRPSSPAVFLFGIAAYLFLLAVRSQIHLGFRHLLPVLPLLIVGAGFALERCRSRVPTALLVAGLAISSLHAWPQGISYFNEWIGGPHNGWKYLADSNVDWGQNLPELGHYIVKNDIRRVKTAVFAAAPLRHYLPDTRLEELDLPFDDSWKGPARLQPTPGVYAISVNCLAGIWGPAETRDYFAYFRDKRPDARAGYSILIYKVGP